MAVDAANDEMHQRSPPGCQRYTPRMAEGGATGPYEQSLDLLERELQRVSNTFSSLSEDEWTSETRLEPFETGRPRWTVFELAGHFDISIGLTRMLIANQEAGQPGRDQVSFFIFPRAEVAPVVYDDAYTMVEGKTPSEMPGVLVDTFSKSIAESRALPPEWSGPGNTRRCGWTSLSPAGSSRQSSTGST